MTKYHTCKCPYIYNRNDIYSPDIPIVPNAAGKWSVIETSINNGDVSPSVKTYTSILTQEGRIVQSSQSSPSINFYGIWKWSPYSKWELYIVSNKQDNDTYIFTPLVICSNQVNKFDTINYEAGSVPMTQQNAGVSYSTWTRIL